MTDLAIMMIVSPAITEIHTCFRDKSGGVQWAALLQAGDQGAVEALFAKGHGSEHAGPWGKGKRSWSIGSK